MKTALSRLFGAALFLGLSMGAMAQNQRILAAAEDGYWYPARAGVIRNNTVHVAFEDGDRGILEPSQIKAFDWRPGMNLECNFDGEGDFYDARIISIHGDALEVVYPEDDSRESTTLAYCRSL